MQSQKPVTGFFFPLFSPRNFNVLTCRKGSEFCISNVQLLYPICHSLVDLNSLALNLFCFAGYVMLEVMTTVYSTYGVVLLGCNIITHK